MRISDWSSDVCSSDLLLDDLLDDRETKAGAARSRGHVRLDQPVAFDRQTDAVVGHLDRHIIVFGIFRKPHHDVAVGLIIARFDRLDRVLDDIGERLSRSEEHTSELQSLMRISYAVFCLKK